ncbi:MAG: phosphopantothenoylcysteine decarboxylase [Planctomycetaceae bacterium]|jgi:phosphopantothenoylcysteine decarboxylase/phosphopantothenate--cysteine ligase|nr:phosphopantothenoylcysteine decarboxylase [Planctomycetaceae bacterium]
MTQPHILITSGPTREYLDPVRYLSNGSSGKMGQALAVAALEKDLRVTVVSGPVSVEYPKEAAVHHVVTTKEMLAKCLEIFPDCSMVIGAAAPCDYRVKTVSPHKIKKHRGKPLQLELVETPDILARLGRRKQHQCLVAFALETENDEFYAAEKLRRKNCDYILLNHPSAIHSDETCLHMIDGTNHITATLQGSKSAVAVKILDILLVGA